MGLVNLIPCAILSPNIEHQIVVRLVKVVEALDPRYPRLDEGFKRSGCFLSDVIDKPTDEIFYFCMTTDWLDAVDAWLTDGDQRWWAVEAASLGHGLPVMRDTAGIYADDDNIDSWQVLPSGGREIHLDTRQAIKKAIKEFVDDG